MTITNTNPQINVDKPNAFHRTLSGYMHGYCVDAIHIMYSNDFAEASNIVVIVDYSKFVKKGTRANFMLTRNSNSQAIQNTHNMFIYNPHNAHVLVVIAKYNKLYAEHCELYGIPREF